MSEFMSRPPLRPSGSGVKGGTACSDRTTRTGAGRRTISSRRDRQKGWCPVDRVHDGLQQTPSLEFVRRDLADGRRGSRSSPWRWSCAGRKWRSRTVCRVSLVTGRWKIGSWRDDAAAGVGWCWCCMGYQPRVHHLPRRLPAREKRQLNERQEETTEIVNTPHNKKANNGNRGHSLRPGLWTLIIAYTTGTLHVTRLPSAQGKPHIELKVVTGNLIKPLAMKTYRAVDIWYREMSRARHASI